MSKDTKPDVWFPLVVGDYLKDTSRLTTEQHGAYLLLLMDYWTGGPPPDDDSALASITKLDARRWRIMRPVMLRYFRIEAGVWRQKRADEELERWAERKRRFAERGRAGGLAKAASSTPQAEKRPPKSLLKSYPSSSSTEVRAQEGALTLCEAKNDFSGPKEVREAFVSALGEPWCRSYLDRCAWQDVPDKALTPATRQAGDKLRGEARRVLESLGIILLVRAA